MLISLWDTAGEVAFATRVSEFRALSTIQKRPPKLHGGLESWPEELQEVQQHAARESWSCVATIDPASGVPTHKVAQNRFACITISKIGARIDIR